MDLCCPLQTIVNTNTHTRQQPSFHNMNMLCWDLEHIPRTTRFCCDDLKEIRTTKTSVGVDKKPTAKAVAKPTAKAKSKASSSTEGDVSKEDKVRLQKKSSDDFKYRYKLASPDIQQAWTELSGRPKEDPERNRLFEAIKNVKRGDYSECQLIITTTLSKESGINWLVTRLVVRPRWKNWAPTICNTYETRFLVSTITFCNRWGDTKYAHPFST